MNHKRVKYIGIVSTIVLLVSLVFFVNAQTEQNILLNENWENGLNSWSVTPYGGGTPSISTDWATSEIHSYQFNHGEALMRDFANPDTSDMVYAYSNVRFDNWTIDSNYGNFGGHAGAGIFELRSDQGKAVIGFPEVVSSNAWFQNLDVPWGNDKANFNATLASLATWTWSLCWFDMTWGNGSVPTGHRIGAINATTIQAQPNADYKVVIGYSHNPAIANLYMWVDDVLIAQLHVANPTYDYTFSNIYAGSVKAEYGIVNSYTRLDDLGASTTYPTGQLPTTFYPIPSNPSPTETPTITSSPTPFFPATDQPPTTPYPTSSSVPSPTPINNLGTAQGYNAFIKNLQPNSTEWSAYWDKQLQNYLDGTP